MIQMALALVLLLALGLALIPEMTPTEGTEMRGVSGEEMIRGVEKG